MSERDGSDIDLRTKQSLAWTTLKIFQFATKDHKPDDPEETKRIEKSGGFVSLPPQTYIPRVNGQLALSRAFGDFQLKMSKKVEQNEQAVITDPDVDIFDRNDISHIGEFIISES